MNSSKTIWMCVTRQCNLSCQYCYQGKHERVPEGFSAMMSQQIAERAMHFAAEWAPEALNVCWYGGEPLLNFPVIKEIVPRWTRERREAGLPPGSHSVTTNGTRLTPEVRDFLDRHQVGMMLSLDGPERIHNRHRPTLGERGSWDQIDPLGVLKWRPRQEIAWQLDPEDFDPASGLELVTIQHVREMMQMGFRNIAFNVNWLDRWSPAACWNLQEFFKQIGLLMIDRQKASDAGRPDAAEIGLGTNWYGKLMRNLTVDERMQQPCGLGIGCVGISPEGWLYPSQEMVYTVARPDRAPGTLEYYRIGDVSKTPVIDEERLKVVSQIKTSDMKPPPGYSCDECVSRSASIGSCHCRNVGQDGLDPANRFDVTPGYCESQTAAMSGLMAAAHIRMRLRPHGWDGTQYLQSMQTRSGKVQHTKPTSAAPPLLRMEQKLDAVLSAIQKVPLVRLEEV